MSQELPETVVSTGDNLRDTAGHQMDLRMDGSSRPDGAWEQLLRLLRVTVDEIGLKECAFQLDCSPSEISHCLNERDRHRFPAKWLPFLVMNSKTDDLPAFIALLRGLAVVPRKVLTPEQKLARLEQALAEELGPDTRRAILAKAFGE